MAVVVLVAHARVQRARTHTHTHTHTHHHHHHHYIPPHFGFVFLLRVGFANFIVAVVVSRVVSFLFASGILYASEFAMLIGGLC